MSDNHQPSDRTPNAERPSPLSSFRPSTQMRTRNVASSDAGRRPPADIAADKSEVIRDVKSATAYLRKANYIQQNEDITIPNLVDALFYLSADKSSNKTTTNVSRAVAILLRDCDFKIQSLIIANAVNERLESTWGDGDNIGASIAEATKKLESFISDSVAKLIESRLKVFEQKISTSIDAISTSASSISDSAATYKEALSKNPPTAPSHIAPHDPHVDPKLIARQSAKARQILIDFTQPEDRAKAHDSSLANLAQLANDAINCADPPVNAKVVNALKLPHGGILVEVDTAEGANSLSMCSNRTIFAKHLGPSAVIRPRSYNVVAYRIPLTFDAKDSENLRELELVNKLPPDSILSARWIKPEARRQPQQLHAHAILSFTTPQLANKAIAEGLTICHKKVDVVKDKREPTRCMKCQLWGHIASACKKTGDTCGTCGKDHRTSACSSSTLRYCTPCLQEGHASWDRDCPSFISKQRELDHRMLDNCLTYFPTDEAWTYTPSQHRGPKTNAPFASHIAPPPSRSLIDRIGPLTSTSLSRNRDTGWKTVNRQRNARKTGGATHSAPLRPLSPSTRPIASSSRTTLDMLRRSTAGADNPQTPRGSGSGSAMQGKKSLRQSTLDFYRTQPSSSQMNETPTVSPTVILTATQELEAIIRPSSNRFTPIAPPDDTEEQGNGDARAPSSTPLSFPSTTPPLSPSPPPHPASPRNWADDPVDSSIEISFGEEHTPASLND